MLAGSN